MIKWDKGDIDDIKYDRASLDKHQQIELIEALIFADQMAVKEHQEIAQLRIKVKELERK